MVGIVGTEIMDKSTIHTSPSLSKINYTREYFWANYNDDVTQ